MTWETAQIEVDNLSATRSAAWVVLPSETESEFVSPTLVATRMVSGERVTASTTGGIGLVGHGLIRWPATTDAVPVGGVMPGPLNNPDFDWIIRQIAPMPIGVAVGTLQSSQDGFSYLSKAKRKLPRGFGLLYVVESSGATLTVNAVADIRCLLQQG